MFVTKTTPPLGLFAVTAIVLEIFLGLGAVGGGLALMAGPNGEILPDPRIGVSGSPFANYFVPGAVLFHHPRHRPAGRGRSRLATTSGGPIADVYGRRRATHLAHCRDRHCGLQQ